MLLILSKANKFRKTYTGDNTTRRNQEMIIAKVKVPVILAELGDRIRGQ